MSQLGIIIKNEYLTDIRAKSFWIGTILVPILMIGFGVFIGFMMAESDTLRHTGSMNSDNVDDLSGMQVLGMMAGIMLTLFLMMYGSQIFAKVKKEKCNRIVEVLATSVTGRTMMLAKIISVALLGFTQLLVWFLMAAVAGIIFIYILTPEIPWNELLSAKVLLGATWTILFFIGGYLFYGSLYAACGAITDKDNENQAYMSVLTFLLLGSFYVGQFAVDQPGNPFVIFCSFFPFTSPTVATVNAVSGSDPLFQTILSLICLYAFAAIALIFSGKLYTSSIMMKGKSFTPKDILLFMKMK